MTDSWAAEFGGNSIAGYRKYVESELVPKPTLAALPQGACLGNSEAIEAALQIALEEVRHRIENNAQIN